MIVAVLKMEAQVANKPLLRMQTTLCFVRTAQLGRVNNSISPAAFVHVVRKPHFDE